MDDFAFGSDLGLQVLDVRDDALPNRAAVGITLGEQILSTHRRLQRSVGAIALYQHPGRTADVDVGDYGQGKASWSAAAMSPAAAK